ncbi:hypothetical protein ACJ41O_003154 [Fusarium nematophilum]
MPFKSWASCLLLAPVISAVALPRAVTEPPASSCTTSISIRYGIDTTVTDYTSWYSSINSKYYTEGWTWSGSRVPIYTQYLTDADGKPTKTAYGFMASDILEADGYQIVSSTFTVTKCTTTTQDPLPPSPTGSICSPHGDHCLALRANPERY